MIVCLCRALSEADVREAAARGAKKADEVYKLLQPHDRSKRCGSCVFTIKEILDHPKPSISRSVSHQGCCAPAPVREKAS
jgi:bacterioferritin-associated ferredoxin